MSNTDDYRTGFGCDVCGGCPRCEEQEPAKVIECVFCGEMKPQDPEADDQACTPCWDSYMETCADMDAADRYTRGAEGGWCDL